MVTKKATKKVSKQKLAPKEIKHPIILVNKYVSKEHQVEVKVLSTEIKLSTSQGQWIWSRATGKLKYAETNATEIAQENAAGEQQPEGDIEGAIQSRPLENTGD